MFIDNEDVIDADEICYICGSDENMYLMLVCDGCNKKTCHTYCDNRIEGNLIPDDDWLCHECAYEGC